MRVLLKKHNLRVTNPRMAVLMAMNEKSGPMTHQELMDTLPKDGFDKASIWRVLANLYEVGLLERMDLGDRIWRYELIDSCRPMSHQHTHFLCDYCGQVYCLPEVSLAVSTSLPAILEGASLKIRVTGTCRDCLSNHP